MGSYEQMVNPLHPSVEDLLSAEFKAIYNKHGANRLRADQVSYDEYKSNPTAYTFPTALVAAPPSPTELTTMQLIPVHDPPGTISIKLYYPTATSISHAQRAAAASATAAPLPLLIDFHGGGFVLGGLADDDALCRSLAHRAGCLVANVAYRTAPEFPHPVPVADGLAALRWLGDNAARIGADRARFAVCGLSAGGCIAAVLAIMARDSGGVLPRLVAQVLVVPVLDVRFVPVAGGAASPSRSRPGSAETVSSDGGGPKTTACPYPSYTTFEFAPCLPLARLQWFYNLWLGTGASRAARAADWRASPMVATSLAGLPPASLHVAGVDPLRSEAEAFHARLEAEGTESRIVVYECVAHPFGQWGGELEAGARVVGDIAEVLRGVFW